MRDVMNDGIVGFVILRQPKIAIRSGDDPPVIPGAPDVRARVLLVRRLRGPLVAQLGLHLGNMSILMKYITVLSKVRNIVINFIPKISPWMSVLSATSGGADWI